MSLLSYISDELARLAGDSLLIRLRTIESAQGAWIQVDGKRVLNMCSNNYLGFANDPRLIAGAKSALDRFGIGPAAVRSIAGTNSLHRELEQRLARFKHTEATLSFQSGFLCNLAVIASIVGETDTVFSDELNHASIIDGCRLARAKTVRYRHADPAHLDALLSQYSTGRKLIITDGVFSMDGDIAPLPEIVEVAESHGAIVMVDDAHGEGVLGRHGRGIIDHFDLQGKIHIEVGTLSKAFGVVGGYVAGSTQLIEFLEQKGRPFLFSSASTPPDIGACIAAVDILESTEEPVRKLWANTKYFRDKIRGYGFDLGKSQTPITPVMIGEARLASEMSRKLFDAGIFAMSIGYPTVPRGLARIRVMNSATHSQEDLDFAAESFRSIGSELGIV